MPLGRCDGIGEHDGGRLALLGPTRLGSDFYDKMPLMIRVLPLFACALVSGCSGLAPRAAPAAPRGVVVTESRGCELLRAGGQVPLIDDFEDEVGQSLPNEGRGGYWYDYDDGTQGTRSREELEPEPGQDGNRALHVVASDYTIWGSGFGVNFHRDSTALAVCGYDASEYSGIRLRARGRGRLRVMLADMSSTPTELGGDCGRPGQSCYDRPGVWLELEPEWKLVEYPFCAFVPEGWGGAGTGIDPARLVGLQFRVGKRESVEAWLDDVSFIPGAAKGSASCGGSACPLESVPKTARVEPAFSNAPLGPELALHTFEQPTRACGALTRRYLTYVPSALGPRTSAPVMIVLHGSGGSAEAARTFQAHDRFDALAARDGFVVVYGNAAPGPHTTGNSLLWNNGTWRQAFYDDGQVDDVRYLELMLQDLEERGLIAGQNPVLLVGHSNGGGMVLEAARRGLRNLVGFAALMPFDGLRPEPPPKPADTGLRRVLFAIAAGDPAMPEGYHELIAEQPARWAKMLGLSEAVLSAPLRRALPNLVFEGEDYRGSSTVALKTRNGTATVLDMAASTGRKAVRVIELANSGHFWPNPKGDHQDWVLEHYGFRNQDFDAADLVWEFLRGALK